MGVEDSASEFLKKFDNFSYKIFINLRFQNSVRAEYLERKKEYLHIFNIDEYILPTF